MTSASLTAGTLASSERDLVVRPRRSRGLGVIVCHGAGGKAADWTRSSDGTMRLLSLLARSGATCWVGDFGGEQTWGNDLSMTRLDAAHAALVAMGCEQGVALIGASMGHLAAVRWATDNPTLVRCVAGLIPAVDIEDMRARDVLGAASDIEAAWGITTGTPVPARGVPLGRVGEMAAPWRAWFGEDDTITTAAAVRSYADAIGQSSGAVVVDDSGLDHSTALFTAIPKDDVADWLLSHDA